MQPVVFAHGFLGYHQFLLWEMFPRVVETLRERGIPAFRTMVHPTASIAERAEQLIQQIEERLGPSEPFHLVGHSMGGLDARYMASPNGLNQGNRILTITTISTPHRGSSLAGRIPRWLLQAASRGSIVGKYLVFGEQRRFLTTLAENRWEGLRQLTPAFLRQEFNPRIVDHPSVRYFSYAGRVDISQPTPMNWLRRPAWLYILKNDGENDGMVAIESAKWGEFKGILPADHGAQIGLRVIPGIKPSFDHLRFFMSVTRDLEAVEKNGKSGNPA
ncbi:MAG: lipase family alpha/beta hydrolase [bacterium]